MTAVSVQRDRDPETLLLRATLYDGKEYYVCLAPDAEALDKEIARGLKWYEKTEDAKKSELGAHVIHHGQHRVVVARNRVTNKITLDDGTTVYPGQVTRP